MRDLVERAKGGDLDAFGVLVDRYKDMAYGASYAILADFHELEIGADREWECAELLIVLGKILGIDLGAVATPAGVMQAAQRDVPIYSIEGDV